MKINIVSKVQIDITQEDMEKLICDKITATDPSINVEGIEFTQRKNPKRLDVTVDASYGPKQSAPATQNVDVEKTVESPSEEVQEELPLDEPTEPIEEESSTETVGDIFS